MKELYTYLNDHLAGSIGALELLDEVIEAQENKPLEQFLKKLREEIEADQRELRRLMKQLSIDESSLRKAGAWVAEKFSRAKLGFGDAGKSNLALLQSLESLSLGITGKRSLWQVLGAIAESEPCLSDFDFVQLENRAADQFERTQKKTVEIAAEIFPPELSEAQAATSR